MNQSVVDAFCAMVRIDSESGEEKEFLSYLADLFRADLVERRAPLTPSAT